MTDRELDQAVAVEVMGWVWRQWKPEPWPYPIPYDCKTELGMRFVCHPDNLGMTDPADESLPILPEKFNWIPPRYSTDRNKTAKVLERIGELGLKNAFTIALENRLQKKLNRTVLLVFDFLLANPQDRLEAALEAVRIHGNVEAGSQLYTDDHIQDADCGGGLNADA